MQPLPTFRYSITTKDQCEKTVSYAIDQAGEVTEENDTGWTQEPDAETEFASLDIAWPEGRGDGVLELTGDQHRQLEDEGDFDQLLRWIAAGHDPADALSRALQGGQA
ncbi:MAG: hypothetical protein A2580_17945 [Hydrogenophilales bacterium RIFOXYD1_FULL_62_11]|nr:MAG: hypothetical protein A2580_17945 [Hydrogenophilales bacterium RIFOXYD1_FULL_62_11]